MPVGQLRGSGRRFGREGTGVLDLPRGIRAEGAVIAARALLAPSGR